jgi:transglutaminase-like putative cysteine protease
VRVWFTRPQRDPEQSVSNARIEATGGAKPRVTTDSEGNEYTYYELENPAAGEFKVTNTFSLKRYEVKTDPSPDKTRAILATDRVTKAHYLRPTQHAIIDDRIKAQANEIVGDETNPVKAARLIYDWVLNNVQYWVKDPAKLKASPTGSTEYCITSRTGNCTDFHSLYMSLARASGIPTRIVYGSLFKPSLDGKDKDQSYHCWIEFWAPRIGWIPLDVAVADIFVGDFQLDEANTEKVTLTTADGYSGPDPRKVDYYFGNLDARRVTWSEGRDLDLKPHQNGGPVNAMPKAYVEVDGAAISNYGRKLTFTERK